MTTFLYCYATFILGCIVGGVVISKLDWYAFKQTVDRDCREHAARVEAIIARNRRVARDSNIAFFISMGSSPEDACRFYDDAAAMADIVDSCQHSSWERPPRED